MFLSILFPRSAKRTSDSAAKIFTLAAVATICMALASSCTGDKGEASASEAPPDGNPPAVKTSPIPMKHGRLHINSIGPLYKVFNDSNPAQLAYAKQIGIVPITDLKSAFRTTRPLVEIKTNDLYLVDSLTHSVPYLVPQAANLLGDIAAAFIDSLSSRSAYGYRVKVTSLLRTPAALKRLRRVNVNASDSSTHRYGTTFDLSYSKFHVVDSTLRLSQEDLKNLLGEVLLDFRNRGRCLVKYERKTACYHITAIK